MKYYASSICFLYLFTLSNSEESQVILKFSEKSKLIGLIEKTTPGNRARHYYAFHGIPYAEPPIGENRFMEPKLLELEQPEYDATSFGPPCTQWLGKQFGSEDCLFINVFTPTLPDRGSSVIDALLPVMLYIHGGAYIIGSSNGNGPKRFMKEDVVLVTFNYRLGVFGYLSTGKKNLPGNLGALDQIAALDWVQKHIHKFGGDPESVTVFGHSAGGGAAHFMTISPLAKGKFNKAILQSGTAVAPWAHDRNPSVYAENFAKRVGCTQEISSSELVECLRQKTSEELMNGQISAIDFWLIPLSLSHVVDYESRGANAFLPEDPEVILDTGNFERIPMMTGVTSDEGLMPYTFLHLNEGVKFSDTKYFRSKIVPRMVRAFQLGLGQSDKVPEIANAVLREYFPGDGELTEDQKIRGIVDIWGDSEMYSPNWNTLHKYVSQGVNNVYSYIFTYKNKHSASAIWYQIKQLREQGIEHPLFDKGLSHVDDKFYLFDPCELSPLNPDFKMTPEDIEFSEFITGIWAAFAKNGSPEEGIKKRSGYPEWKPLDIKSGSVNYYNLTIVPAPMGEEFREQKSIFWKNIYKNLGVKSEDFRMMDEL